VIAAARKTPAIRKTTRCKWCNCSAISVHSSKKGRGFVDPLPLPLSKWSPALMDARTICVGVYFEMMGRKIQWVTLLKVATIEPSAVTFVKV
jgi:hypothetical protein